MKDKNDLTLGQHFRELRNRFLWCIGVFVVCFVTIYCFSNRIVGQLLSLGTAAGFKFAYLTPQELLIQALRVSAILALLGSMPIIVYHVIEFIAPCFDSKIVKHVFRIGAIFASILFCAGILFCVLVLFPFVFKYLYTYANGFDVVGMISVEAYFDLFILITMIMGVLFELPLFCGVLALCRVLTSKRMLAAFRPAIIVIMIVSAFVTPPDVISMLMVAVPMIVIYAISIVICHLLNE